MKEDVLEILFALIKSEISGETISGEIIAKITPEILKPLYKISKKHDLAHLVANALEKLDKISYDSEAGKAFLTARDMAIFRVEMINAEIETICEVFERGKIDYLPLKGAVIRKLYPESWMRTSCDIDILVKKEELQRAIDLLKNELDYDCKSIGQHDAQIYAPNGVHLELHFSLLESGSKPELVEILDSVWELSEKITDCQYKMPNHLFYLYLLSHEAKHIKFGGCGIRAFLDMWLIREKLTFDETEKKELLVKSKYTDFAKASENLCDCWFNGREFDDFSKYFADYVITGGVYGTSEQKSHAQQSRKKNKFTYLLYRIFIPYRELKYSEPTLKKHPVLYPFFLVKRIFKAIFKKETKEKTSKEIKAIASSGDETKKLKKFFSKLDI